MNTISSEHERIINRMLRPRETEEVITITKSDVAETVADITLYKAGKAGFSFDAATAAKLAAVSAYQQNPGEVRQALRLGELVAHVSDPDRLHRKYRHTELIDRFRSGLALAHYQTQLDEQRRAEHHGNADIVRIPRSKRQYVGVALLAAPAITIPTDPAA